MNAIVVFNFRQEARRLFSSAPISKIYDVFTLETSDGVCIILKGFINKQQTILNGFPDEVLNNLIVFYIANICFEFRVCWVFGNWEC